MANTYDPVQQARQYQAGNPMVVHVDVLVRDMAEEIEKLRAAIERNAEHTGNVVAVTDRAMARAEAVITAARVVESCFQEFGPLSHRTSYAVRDLRSKLTETLEHDKATDAR